LQFEAETKAQDQSRIRRMADRDGSISEQWAVMGKNGWISGGF